MMLTIFRLRLVTCLAGGLFLACLALGCGKASEAKPEEDRAAPVMVIAARTTRMGEWTELLGTTQPLPDRVARVSAAVEGHVLSVLGDGKGKAVAEGERVQEGQVIARLDDRVVRANRDKAAAQLGDLAQQKKQAQYAVQLAEIDVRRLAELRRGSGSSVPLVSRVELEKAQIAVKEAKSREEGVAAREALVRTELKALDAQLAFYTLRAPITGRLGLLQVVPGQTLTPGTTVADVVDLDQIDVLCYAPPDAAVRLALDQPAKLMPAETTSAEARQPRLGKVAFIAVQAQPETGNVAVKVRFPNPGPRLRAHAIVQVSVLTRPERERLVLPEAAIAEDRDIPTVVAVQDVKTEKKDGEEQTVGKVRKLQAVLGVRDRARRVVEILGLEDPATKEQVALQSLLFVTAGGHGLQNGDTVKLQKEAEKEAK
jgi:RND family efflux transporter MFP subunit